MPSTLRLIQWKILLTWRLYTRNTLASFETFLFFIVITLWVIGGYVATYHLTDWLMTISEIPRALVYADIFSFILVMWILMSLAGYRMNESFDLDRLRIFPLSSGSVFSANLFGSFIDLSVLLPLSGMVAAFIGSRPSPNEIPLGLLIIFAMFFFTILAGITLVNLLYIFLPRLNLLKVGIFILVMMIGWAILLNLGYVEYPMASFFHLFRPKGLEIFRNYPTGQAGILLAAAVGGASESVVKPLLGFVAWTGGFLLTNYLLVLFMWNGDAAGKRSSGSPGIQNIGPLVLDKVSPFLSPMVGMQAFALYRKDMLEFAFRSPYFLFYKALPGSIAPMIILLAMHWNLNNLVKYTDMQFDAEKTLTYVTIATVLFIVIAQGNLFAGNQFGLEDAGIKNMMVLPTPRRYFLLGKNLFLGTLFLFDSIVLSSLLTLYFPGVHTFLAWLSLLVTMFLLIISIGNFASTIWPYWMPLDKPSFTLRSTVILGLVNSGAVFVLAFLFAPPLAAVIIPHLYGMDWLSFLMMPLSVFYGIQVHRFCLKPAVSLLESNEFLILRRVAEREEL